MTPPPFTLTDAVDLFAGPGGWDVAARRNALHTVGIELDPVACQTRRAAGLAAVEGSVTDYGPDDFFPLHDTLGLIASPPCQTFSNAGNGVGRRALDVVLSAIAALERREPLPAAALADERTALVLEPLRWALDALDQGRPFSWLAFEQVPTVLPVWQAMAAVLDEEGYTVATGNVNAETYGVPQTRKRALLVASLDGPAALPVATHSRYNARTPDRLDEGVLPWRSMVDALGPEYAGRAFVATNLRPNAAIRETSLPAATLAFGHESPRWLLPDGSIVRATAREAGTLQTFPAAYPWSGGSSKVWQQIGNAVPPLLAEHVLRAVGAI